MFEVWLLDSIHLENKLGQHFGRQRVGEVDNQLQRLEGINEEVQGSGKRSRQRGGRGR